MDYFQCRLSMHVAPHMWNKDSAILRNIRSDFKTKCSIWESCHPGRNTPGCSIFRGMNLRVASYSVLFFYLLPMGTHTHNQWPTAQSLITYAEFSMHDLVGLQSFWTSLLKAWYIEFDWPLGMKFVMCIVGHCHRVHTAFLVFKLSPEKQLRHHFCKQTCSCLLCAHYNLRCISL